MVWLEVNGNNDKIRTLYIIRNHLRFLKIPFKYSGWESLFFGCFCCLSLSKAWITEPKTELLSIRIKNKFSKQSAQVPIFNNQVCHDFTINYLDEWIRQFVIEMEHNRLLMSNWHKKITKRAIISLTHVNMNSISSNVIDL